MFCSRAPCLEVKAFFFFFLCLKTGTAVKHWWPYSCKPVLFATIAVAVDCICICFVCVTINCFVRASGYCEKKKYIKSAMTNFDGYNSRYDISI